MRVLKYGRINDMPYSESLGISLALYNSIKDKWKAMFRRSYSDEFHETYPTYKDCSVCSEWIYLSNFYKWIINEPLFEEFSKNIKGYCIDKDALHPGNKVYSPKYCILTTKSANSIERIERLGVPEGGKWTSVNCPSKLIENRIRQSEFMKNNNPMQDEAARLKVSKSLQVSVIGIHKKSNEIVLLKCIGDAEFLGLNPTGISHCLKGTYKSSCGYIWYKVIFRHTKSFRIRS